MKKFLSLLIISSIFCVSCNDFLDELPDNRAEVDNMDEVAKLLVSAYPEISHTLIAEMSADNVDDFKGPTNPYSDRFIDQIATWRDVTEDENESPANVWDAHYKAIACANHVLATIKELGETENLLPYKGEALLARAYNHFILVNMFSWHYNKKTSEQDLGIPYIKEPETELSPKYDRGTVAQVYELIEKDLEEGLPLIKDDIYKVPKYHFTRNASYAFATRFYLYYEKYDKVIEYANRVLGNNPSSLMRNWAALGQKTYDYEVFCQDYINDTHKSNLLLSAATSGCGAVFGLYTYCKRFTHTYYKTATETLAAPAPWGSFSSGTYNYYYPISYMGSESYDHVALAKMPYYMEYTDRVAGIGLYKSVFALFQAEEVLFNRAEAYIHTKRYAEAVADIVTWQNSRFITSKTATLDNINKFYSGIDYYDPMKPTTKHKLNPLISTPITDSIQENLTHCILHARRVHTLFEGLRWFDIKRYGIVIHRRLLTNSSGPVDEVYDNLGVNDLRRVIQLPLDVIAAGLKANPRNN
jgi:hypothetical protein